LIVLDSLSLSEGSLKQYLKEHLSAYKKHEDRLEALLGQPVGQLRRWFLRPQASSRKALSFRAFFRLSP
jgi:hypothetical protein